MSQGGITNRSGGGGGGSPVQTLTGNSGGAVPPTGNNINTTGTGSITVAGNAGTSTLVTQLTGITNHAVQIGAGTATLTQLGPIASTGAMLQSNGLGSDPGFSTSTWPATTTINQILYSSAANTVSGLTNGTTGQVLTATTGAAPSWAANPGITGTATQFDVLVGAAGNTIASVGPGSAGQVLQSGGAASNPAYSTATYPLTTTSQQILYSTAANTIGQLTTANSSFPATNSSGTLAMRGLSVVKQVITTTGTYTPTAGMVYCDIIVVGGGGAGSGAGSTTGVQISGGGGGGSGEYAQGTFSAATIGASQSVTIGAAGVGASAASGGNGGNTSIGALISANGGAGGNYTAPGAVSGQNTGGIGGTGGTGGTIRSAGAPGGIFCFSSGSFGFAGNGGAGFLGGNGLGVAGGTGAGIAGTGYGSGGGGALSIGTGAAQTGGNGAKGAFIVTEYVIA